MDLNFVKIGSMRGTRIRARIDYPAFLAGITAAQAILPSARIGAALKAAPLIALSPAEAVATVFMGQAGWSCAAVALGGSFHPAAARLLAAKGV